MIEFIPINNMGFLNMLSSYAGQKRRNSVSWFQKKRIHPIDCFGTDNITKNKVNGLKLSSPFILIVIVCIIAGLCA